MKKIEMVASVRAETKSEFKCEKDREREIWRGRGFSLGFLCKIGRVSAPFILIHWSYQLIRTGRSYCSFALTWCFNAIPATSSWRAGLSTMMAYGSIGSCDPMCKNAIMTTMLLLLFFFSFIMILLRGVDLLHRLP